MKTIDKVACLLIVLSLALSTETLMVNPARGQSIPKPSVPEFTLKLLDNSYIVPETVTIDPFTGANITHPSHQVDNKSIEVTIKNQPFTSTLIQEGNSNWTTTFYYNVHFKGHFSNDWIPMYFYGDPFPTASNTNYTTINYPLQLTGLNASSYYLQVTGIPANAQIDFQVQAMIGNFHRSYNATATDQMQMFPWVFEGQTSDWNTQTITLPPEPTEPTPTSSISSNITPTPIAPETSYLAILPLLVGGLAVALALKHRKTIANQKDNQQLSS